MDCFSFPSPDREKLALGTPRREILLSWLYIAQGLLVFRHEGTRYCLPVDNDAPAGTIFHSPLFLSTSAFFVSEAIDHFLP